MLCRNVGAWQRQSDCRIINITWYKNVISMKSDCRIINITWYKNVISMKRSARRQKMYVLYTLYAQCFDLHNRSMADSEVRISKAISYATKALGYSELRPNQELAVKHFLRGHDIFVSLACPQAVVKDFATAFFPRPFTFYGR